MKRKLLLSLSFVLALCNTKVIHSQVTIGSNVTPDANALLDLKNQSDGTSTKGLLLPRVGLRATNDSYPMNTSLLAGMIVYNTATDGVAPNNVTPGYYYYNGSKWIRIADAANASNYWSILGNAGTTAGTNFLGTTDNANLVFKRNKIFSGLLDVTNTSLGVSAFANNTDGANNVAMGVGGLASNTIGSYNTAIGANSLYSNIEGSNNSALGYNSLYKNTGHFNSALGSSTLYNNTGWNNTAVGYQGLYNNTTGNNNSAIGQGSLLSNTTGGNNSGVGTQSLYSNLTGNYNSSVGVISLYYNTSGDNNSALGYQSLYYNTTGANNIAIGSQSLVYNTAGSNGIAIGYKSQYNANNTTTAWSNANTSVGYQSMMGPETRSTNTGNYNSSYGFESLMNNSSGMGNTAQGAFSLLSNTTGGYNVSLGYGTLIANVNGNANVSIGNGSMSSNNSGSTNIAIGPSTLSSNIDASNSIAIGESALNHSNSANNVAIGIQSLFNLTSGTNNTALGYYSGNNLTTGSNNIVIGKNQNLANDETDNQLNIGGAIFGAGLNGSVSSPAGMIGIDVTTPTNTLHVKATSNPLRLEGLQTASSDSVLLTNATGVVKYGSFKALTTSNAWSLTGNSGTTPGTNFLGTTDDKDLVLKRNNVQSGWLNNTNRNTSYGVSSYPSSTLTSLNVDNTAIGYGTLIANTDGDNNTAIGSKALNVNTTGSGNTAIGSNTLTTITTAKGNTAVGQLAMSLYGNSNYNTSLGYSALNSGTVASNNNVAIGALALNSNSISFDNGGNIAIGYKSLYKLPSGAGGMVVIGTNALSSLTNSSTGTLVAIGGGAMEKSTGGFNLVAIGQGAMYQTNGNDNTAIGFQTMYGDYSGTSAYNNTSLGSNSMHNFSSGASNVAIGTETMKGNTANISNITANTAVGASALKFISSGSNYNTAIGNNALDSLGYTVAGSNNVALGYNAGIRVKQGDNNIIIGSNQKELYSNTGSNQLNIGGAIFGTGMTGTATAPAGNIGIKTAAPVSTLEVAGSFGTAITTLSSGTLDATQSTIIVTGNLTIPTPDTTNKGRIYSLVLGDNNSYTITGTFYWPGDASNYTHGSRTINTSNNKLVIQSDGTRWIVLQTSCK